MHFMQISVNSEGYFCYFTIPCISHPENHIFSVNSALLYRWCLTIQLTIVTLNFPSFDLLKELNDLKIAIDSNVFFLMAK